MAAVQFAVRWAALTAAEIPQDANRLAAVEVARTLLETAAIRGAHLRSEGRVGALAAVLLRRLQPRLAARVAAITQVFSAAQPVARSERPEPPAVS